MNMLYYLISPLRVVSSSESLLTYHFEESLLPGQIVMVPVGKKEVAGVVMESAVRPEFKTKPITRVVQTTAIPSELSRLQEWMSQYYMTHPVQVWQTMLPSGLLKKRRKIIRHANSPKRERTTFVLNKEQNKAVTAINTRSNKTTLLHGITGSGKTAIYIELLKRTLAEGKSAIVLVPEIALTSQISADLSQEFDNVIITHSTMTESERHQIWQEILESKSPVIVLGPRSALFMPIKRVGLIVVDECHEPSYKQEKSPRYSAIRTASKLREFHKARLILGSATPNIADYHLAVTKDPSSVVTLTKLAVTSAILPDVTVVDMTKRENFSRSQFLSTPLISQIQSSLENKQQVLLFHNRRGNAPMTLCENCGWSAGCIRCFIPMTLHADNHVLICHICNRREPVPMVCPTCKKANIIHKGIGTKKVAEEISRLFPTARIARFDGDNTVNETVSAQYQSLYDGDIDIIIGTQVIAKGLDLPKLRLVGVIQADSGLALPDYFSTERVFQLLMQVSGRVGRNQHPSSVIVQSYQPTHPSIIYGIQRNYQGFYNFALAERKRADFPPYCYLLKLTCRYKTESHAIQASRQLVVKLKKVLDHRVQVLGPTPAFYERVGETYRWQIVLKSRSRSDLAQSISHLPGPYWQYELDPPSLL